MHLTCTMTQAFFPLEGVRLYAEKPLPLLWDCHHGDTFVLKVEGLAVEPLAGEARVSLIILEVSLAPLDEVLSKIEYFAAHHNLALSPWPTLPEELEEPLTLAACHLPEAKLFVFCEAPTLKARTTPGLAATPPSKAIGGMNFLPRAITPLKFRATAKHKPATIS